MSLESCSTNSLSENAAAAAAALPCCCCLYIRPRMGSQAAGVKLVVRIQRFFSFPRIEIIRTRYYWPVVPGTWYVFSRQHKLLCAAVMKHGTTRKALASRRGCPCVCRGVWRCEYACVLMGSPVAITWCVPGTWYAVNLSDFDAEK